MAGKAAAPGTAVLLVTANVGSLFDDVVHTHKPHFMALHCQEFGGKNYEASMSHVDKFVKELLSSDAMKEYNRARVYLDENFKSQEHFTALGSFYFLHESLKNIYQFDFKAKKYKKVTGKEIYSDTLESTPMLEKEKFPQDYFPECKWSRKGFVRTRWCVADCAFDLVNIHLFHDASNLVAWETSPSVYSGIRHKALGYVLDRIIDQRFENVSYFVFGDFNFRLDSKSVVETLCTKATMQTVRAADTNEVVKLIFRESDNDRKVMLQLEKKLFDYFNQEVFRDNNGTALLEFDKELSVFKDRLYELDISFPPSYPYSEDSGQGQQYMNTRCPAWCDRVLMSPSARELILKAAGPEHVRCAGHTATARAGAAGAAGTEKRQVWSTGKAPTPRETAFCRKLSVCGQAEAVPVDCFVLTLSLDASELEGAPPPGRRPPGPPRGCPAAAGVTVGSDAPREQLLGLIHHATLGYLVTMFRSASPALKHQRWRAGGAAWELPGCRHCCNLLICLKIMQLETHNFMLPL
ncbi:inositol polyphosphate-5-phosphatase A isoform X2 [Mirounga angustirostris]|uniref:inositol polyphosphate-5-phosphatase A isoform X2 n=1 Tax=Mirounga angustirostris TaxID=9716 RepID=UPI00313B4080